MVKRAADEAGKQEDAAEYLEDGGADNDYLQVSGSLSKIRKREKPGGIQITDTQSDSGSIIIDGTSYSEEIID
ncbi:MAG: hypothetical protein NC916_03285 [Candidatus Omnitrophica bacterium]|nr:hypothetical protein [Candidatus Omnitrophota bacterium]